MSNAEILRYVLSGVIVLVLLVGVGVFGRRFARKAGGPSERAVRWLAVGLLAAVIALFGLGLVGVGPNSALFSSMMTLLLGAAALYWIAQLLDCLTAPSRQDDERVAWVLTILLLPVVGAFLYQVVGRERVRGAARQDSPEPSQDA